MEQSHGEGNGSRGHRVSMEVIFSPPFPSHLPGTAGHGGEGVTPSNAPELGKLKHTPADNPLISSRYFRKLNPALLTGKTLLIASDNKHHPTEQPSGLIPGWAGKGERERRGLRHPRSLLLPFTPSVKEAFADSYFVPSGAGRGNGPAGGNKVILSHGSTPGKSKIREQKKEQATSRADKALRESSGQTNFQSKRQILTATDLVLHNRT